MFSSFDRYRAKRASTRGKIGRRICAIEPLESRSLLSASALSTIIASPFAKAATTATVSAPYTPAEVRAAYGITGNGSGQTIAIVDAYDDPKALSDLKAFDAKYGLSDPTFVKVNQKGSTTSLPTANSGWGLEIALDVEWAHAVAPAAKILLVEANSASLSDLLTAVKYASTQASVVSMSWGSSEFSSETQYDSYFSTSGVTYVASSGDTGGIINWPSVSPKVLAVGGTSLTISSTTNGSTTTYSYSSEKGWSGSGGGNSRYETEPTWQYAVQTSGKRSTPDVSYDANSSTGFAVYDTYGYSGWITVGGTSAGAPQWAGLIATANQGRAAKGLSTLSNAASDLYALKTTSTYSTNFYDVTSGTAGRYSCSTGYDLVTGLGSPKASSIISALIASSDTVSSSGSSGSSSNNNNNYFGPGGRRTPGSGFWGWLGSARRSAEVAGGWEPSATNLPEAMDYPDGVFRTVDSTSLSPGYAQLTRAGNPVSSDVWAGIILGGEQEPGSSAAHYNTFSFHLWDDVVTESGNDVQNVSNHGTEHPSADRAAFDSASPALALRLEAPDDSASAFSQRELHLRAIDACHNDATLQNVRVAVDDAPTAPGPEKAGKSLRAEALAAVLLAYGRAGTPKDQSKEDENLRRFGRFCRRG
jgi:hypothetical protein